MTTQKKKPQRDSAIVPSRGPYERNKPQDFPGLEDALGPEDEVEIVFHMLTNPLTWHEAEEPPLDRFPPIPLTPEQGFHEFLCGWREYHRDLEGFKAAYRKITALEKATPILFVPEEARILLRMLLPLRHAKAAYVLGNYFGAIALCGLVAEMVAILIFEIEGLQLPEGKQKGTFEHLGQEERVKVLKAHEVLTQEQIHWFGTLRAIRRDALHFLMKPPPTERRVLDAYRAALGLLATTLGIPGKGSFGFNPKVIAMLERKGVATRFLSTDPDRHKPKRRGARIGLKTY